MVRPTCWMCFRRLCSVLSSERVLRVFRADLPSKSLRSSNRPHRSKCLLATLSFTDARCLLGGGESTEVFFCKGDLRLGVGPFKTLDLCKIKRRSSPVPWSKPTSPVSFPLLVGLLLVVLCVVRANRVFRFTPSTISSSHLKKWPASCPSPLQWV